MILMSKYKGQLHGEKGSTNSGSGLPPPFSSNARKKTFIFTGGVPLQDTKLQQAWLAIYIGKSNRILTTVFVVVCVLFCGLACCAY